MQDCLNSVEIWSHKWGLEFSSSKTKAIIFTHRHCTNVAPLTFQGKEIEYVQKIKFLGMYFDRKLTWSYHIKYVADKCQRDLQLLRVVAGSNWGANFSTLKMLYLALLRSKLEYGSFLYDTAAKSNLIILDRIQYKAIRIMLGALKCTNVNKLEMAAQILPLSLLRKKITCTVHMSCIDSSESAGKEVVY